MQNNDAICTLIRAFTRSGSPCPPIAVTLPPPQKPLGHSDATLHTMPSFVPPKQYVPMTPLSG